MDAPSNALTKPVDRNDGASAPAVCLLAEVGQGKTTSIRTLCAAGIEVFLLTTDPGFEDILGDIPNEQLKWHYVPAYDQDMKSFEGILKNVNTMDLKAMKEMPGQNKTKYQQMFDLSKALNNFVDQRSGVSYGDVQNWGPERCLALDSLSGVTNMVERMTCGDKPFMNYSEYEAAQFIIEQFVNIMCSGTKAMFVMTSHVRRVTDKNTGVSQLMMDTTGTAVSPKLYRNFSDVVYCHLEMENGKPVGRWDTFSKEVRVKTRNLPLTTNLPADFGPLVANWKKRNGL